MARGLRSEGRREEIIAAAAELFGRLGYHQTSMEDIAQAVGISKPTLYHYTNSKSDIVFWIHDALADRMITNLERCIADGVPPQERLWHVINETLLVMEQQPGHLNVFFEHYRDLDPAHQAEAKRKRDHYFAMVASSIREGVADGTLTTDDPELSALALFGMTNWAYQWFRPDGRHSRAQIAAHLWTLLLQGLGTKAGPRRIAKVPRRSA